MNTLISVYTFLAAYFATTTGMIFLMLVTAIIGAIGIHQLILLKREDVVVVERIKEPIQTRRVS